MRLSTQCLFIAHSRVTLWRHEVLTTTSSAPSCAYHTVRATRSIFTRRHATVSSAMPGEILLLEISSLIETLSTANYSLNECPIWDSEANNK